MTDKQERILRAALDLFANFGYNATSTSKIAHHAGVSEGLIFKHYKNKKGLLDALVKEAEARIAGLVGHILTEEDPKKTIRRTISLPFAVEKSEYDFWRLQFKLKWEKEYDNPQKMKPLADKLTWAFEKLQYADPEREAHLLAGLVDTIAIELLRGNLKQQKAFETFLLEKYAV